MPGTGLALADDERDAGLLDVVIMDLTFFQISNPSPEIAEAIKSLRFIHQNMVARFDPQTGVRHGQAVGK